MRFRSFKGFPSRGRLFHSVRAADTSPIHYSLFSLIYYLTPPLAPSDEGAVNEVDWGREPDFVFPQRSKNHADDPVYQIPTPGLLREDYVN